MRVCRVIGHVVATAKHPAIQGKKILVVADSPDRGDPGKPMELAVDGVGAGVGNEVLVVESGEAGSQVTGVDHAPVRSVVIGIVD
jgi:ethanolamine utilization protein EutN